MLFWGTTEKFNHSSLAYDAAVQRGWWQHIINFWGVVQ